jgi:hypothetical protein
MRPSGRARIGLSARIGEVQYLGGLFHAHAGIVAEVHNLVLKRILLLQFRQRLLEGQHFRGGWSGSGDVLLQFHTPTTAAALGAGFAARLLD